MRIISLIFLLICALPLVQSAQFAQVLHGIELTGMPSGHTSGVSWYDFDHDGWDDLTVGQGNDAILVLRNVNGVLTLVHAFPNTTQVKTLQWVDYDNDGDSDFFVCAANAGCKLLRNDGELSFTDVSANLSLPSAGDDSMGASWADYDRDGFLDVYVCNYFSENWLLHNLGNGSFENVADDLGVSDSNRPTYMCTWVDYNNDCLLDLYVANDLGFPSEMFENNGNGFTAVGAAIGLNVTIEAMGLCWSDYDNDLDLDVYITNVASGNRLMRNDNGIFTNVAFESGAAVQALSWGCMWMDIDHDTYDDLHVLTQAPLVNQNINFLLKQQSDHSFIDISMPADMGNSFSSAKGDLNNDGYWDFCDVFTFPSRFFVWQNDGGANHWMKLDLNGSNGNSDAVGAKIFYWHGEQQYYAHTYNGESFFGQDSQYEILSLGTSEVVDSLRVEWPSGRSDMFYNLAADQLHELAEGSSALVSIMASKDFLCSGSDEVMLSVPGAGAVEWWDGSTEYSITINEPGAYWAQVTSVCGAIDSLGVQIAQLPAPVIEELLVHPSCAGFDDGCADVLLNGMEPMQLLWTGFEPNEIACDVPAGSYSYEAVDENACSVFGTLALLNPQPVEVASAPVIICGDTTAAALLSATGGTGEYVYTIQGEFDMNALHPGDYVGIATDANGCVGSVNFSIQAFPEVNFTASADSICFGEVASLQYFGSGGALPYTYDWQGQNPNALPSGWYEFTLTDGNGCEDVVNVIVAEFPFLDAQISFFSNANDGNNGSMELSILGGEPPYSILWSTGNTDEVLDGIGQGSYSVTVTDANGCVSSDTQSIIDLDVAEVFASIQVYPNPVTSSLTLVSLSTATYEILDGCGRLVHSGKLLPGLNTIDCAGWSEGIYVVNYLSAQGRGTSRVVKG